MKNLLIRTLTGIVIIILTVSAIVANEISLFALVEIIFLIGASELSKMVSFNRDLKYLLTIISGAVMIAISFLLINGKPVIFWFALPLGIFLLVILFSFLKDRSQFKSQLFFYLPALLWLAIPLSLFMALGRINNLNEYNYRLPLLVIVLTWINDTFAYLAGSVVGKHKMTPRLSPNKTWEGFAGGLIITILAGWIVFMITNLFNIRIWIILSIVIVIFGLLGDLFESRYKRMFKVKDSGSLLPGHGGVLDRFDSLLFSAPAAYLLIQIINLAK